MTRTNREMVQIFLPVVDADAPVGLYFFGRSAAATVTRDFSNSLVTITIMLV
ncbi:hypothetical protein RDI58_028519 [Solanum bulbocastanum]|uniref:Uncharacterized protein n=1 Tax=Solanum bulbocastanum TaxID=147425 RepID=A0AAN8SUD6_SOLBU